MKDGVFGCVGGEEGEPITFIIFCPAYVKPQTNQSLEHVCLNKSSGKPNRLI